MACTTILVGKNASYDGSTMIARNDDSGSGHFTAKKFTVFQPQDYPAVYKSVISGVEIPLPGSGLRITAVPNAVEGKGLWAASGVNAANVGMTATETITSNPRVLGADPLVKGGIGEEDIVYLVLPYVRSAREGVRRLGSLLEQYGTYEMNGIAFQDVDEVWWLETIGGHHWMARRVPDDVYVAMPNQLGLDTLDLDDALGEQKEFMCSADLRGFIDKHHLDLSLDGVLNPRDAFGSHDDADHVYNTPRGWYMLRYFNPNTFAWDGPDADHKPTSDDIPWARQPERKVTIEDIKYVLSSHYQGTEYDCYGSKGTPATRGAYRPIGINRNSQLAVLQLRPYAQPAYRAVQWMAFGSNSFNALVPLYANVETMPEYYADTQARVTSENFYWANRLIGALADVRFHECGRAVEDYQEKVGGMGHKQIHDVDAVVAALPEAEVPAELARANEAFAERVRVETDALLGKVLYTTSCAMKNSFAMNDNVR